MAGDELSQKTETNGNKKEQTEQEQHPFHHNFREFMSGTTLHGFRYIYDEKFTWVERMWWFVMVISSIAICTTFICKVWNKWDTTPVIVSFADNSNSVWHLPFPAVTLCSETKTRQRVFNFTKASLERWSVPSTISFEDLKIYQDLMLLCDNDNNTGTDYINKSSIETLQKLAPTREDVFLDCFWDNFTCNQMFYHTLTKDGFCFTFNMLSVEEMFKTENLHKDYYHVAAHNNLSAWSLEYGYPLDETIDTYPLRGPSYGGVEFEVTLLTDIRDMDQVCRGPVQGYKVWIHSPAELPNMGQNFFRVPVQYQTTAAITPRVMDTSEGLRHYHPHKRQCYFSDERYLSFFRAYTYRNCELECSSNYTALRCGCVPLYMPHGPDTKVCGGKKRMCVLNALEELSLAKSSLSKSRENGHQCDCLQACTEIKYDAETSLAVYDLTTYRMHPNPEIAKGWRLPSGLVLYFSEELYTSLRRSELYGSIDFIANCGGIMGLFMGFSFLSLVEIFYYFTLRLWCQVRKSKSTDIAINNLSNK